MRPPPHWYRPAGLLASALRPLGWLYATAGAARIDRGHPYRAEVPVICVGNLVAGGAGKTPVALSIAERLRVRGVRPGFLTRGYGGRLKGPVLVDPARHTARDVGDEPLLLAQMAPTWVGADRAASAREAVAHGAEALVMDDGFQNPGLVKDLSLLVVDGEVGFGNGLPIPAGPLREPIDRGLRRAQGVVVMGRDQAGIEALVDNRLPVLEARLMPDPAAAEVLEAKPVVAFAGIGRPAKFFDTLVALGAHPVLCIAFPDHHRYRADDVMRLVDAAHERGAELVTTCKDFARLPLEAKPMVRSLPVAVRWDNPDALDRLLDTPRCLGHAH